MREIGIFGKDQPTINHLLQREEYRKCYEMYSESEIDCDRPDIREMKLTFYQILAEYLIYDPSIGKVTSTNFGVELADIFSVVSTDDPDYENKMSAILIVFFYAVKNRSFNYALSENACHEEVIIDETLRGWLEENAERIIMNNAAVRKIFAALMTLLYDKILTATVEIYHSGEDVVTGVTTYSFGTVAYSDLKYENTGYQQKINALRLLGLEEYRDDYILRRNTWKGYVQNPDFTENKNLFLFGTYNLDEFNRFLSRYDFKLFKITTKFYANFLCDGDIYGIGKFISAFYLITGNSKKEKEFNKKHKDWTFFQKVFGFLRGMPIAILIVLVLNYLLLLSLEENTRLGISVLVGILVAFTPPINRAMEKKKRKTFSIF